MDFYSMLLAKKLKKESGGDVTIESLVVTENGNYSDTGKAYSPVIVNVQPTLETLNATANGTYTPQGDGYSEVTVNVPLPENGYLLESASGQTVNITDAAPLYLQECKAEIESVQEGSGDPSPTNIRPISGQTEVVIEDCGKNLCSGVIQGVYLGIDGTFNSNYTDYSTMAQKIRISPSTTYTFTCDVGVNSGDNAILFYDKDNNYLGRSTLIVFSRQNSITFTTPNNAHYLVGNVKQEVTDVGYFQLEFGSTASEYEPYKGKTYTIQLGDTIYGGELDVLTGELRVTHGEVDLGDLTWKYQEDAFRSDSINSLIARPINDKTVPNVLTPLYKPRAWNDSADMGVYVLPQIWSYSMYLNIMDSRYTDPNVFKSAMNGVQLVYELATPYTIQLTPRQIRLLEGVNNLSCNTGELNIEYFEKGVN